MYITCCDFAKLFHLYTIQFLKYRAKYHLICQVFVSLSRSLLALLCVPSICFKRVCLIICCIVYAHILSYADLTLACAHHSCAYARPLQWAPCLTWTQGFRTWLKWSCCSLCVCVGVFLKGTTWWASRTQAALKSLKSWVACLREKKRTTTPTHLVGAWKETCHFVGAWYGMRGMWE